MPQNKASQSPTDLRSSIGEKPFPNDLSGDHVLPVNQDSSSPASPTETSREELNSINRELTSANLELTTRVGELGDANSDLHNLMSATDIATVFLDRELRIARFTPSAKALFNFISTDLGRPLSDLARKLDYPEIAADAEHALTQLTPTQREIRSSEHCFLARALPYRTVDDHIAGVVFTFTDITTMKQAEAAAARLAAIVESSSDAIVGKDLRGVVLSWNAGAEKIFGYTAAEMIGQPVLRLIPPERQNEETEILQKIGAGETIKSFETVRLRKDGSSFPISVTISPIKDATGKIIGGSKIARDISEAKATERALKEREEEFRTLAEAVPQVVWATRPDGWNIYFNQRWVDYTGLSMEESYGHGWLKPFHPDDRPRSATAWQRAVDFQEPYSLECRLRRADGVYRWWLIRGAPQRNAQGEILKWFGTCTDIEEIKQTSAALLEAKNAAEMANQSKDRFLAVLSHELRTPLTPVLMVVGALEHDPDLRPEVREDLAMIKRNVELETKLIDDLLDLSRITSGKVELKSENIDLNELVDQVCAICRPQLAEARVQLETHLDPQAGVIAADPARLQQVLWNVLKNAAKFTSEGGYVRVSTTRLGQDRCEVRVTDTGIGIPPEVLPRVFNAFEQGDASVTRQFGGLGLGLAISRALVELHGGTIRAESAGRGHGATFVVELPGLPAAVAAAQLSVDSARNADTRQIRLLLVEDHADTARTLARLLRAAGFAVVPAANVASAVALAEHESFDLLVSDLGLPDGDGFQIMRAVRAKRIVPGIAMSGYGMEEDIRRSTEAGFTEHLVKPINITQLIETIRRVTENRV